MIGYTNSFGAGGFGIGDSGQQKGNPRGDQRRPPIGNKGQGDPGPEAGVY